MVRRGDIALADVGEEGNAAEFAIVDAARVSGGRPGQSGHVMALSISWSQLSDPEKNDAWWTLVLYHEYVHFIQYRDGHQPAGTFMMNSLDLSSPDQVEKQCTQKRHAEEAAYHQECELAVKLGSEAEMSGLCRGVNDLTRFRKDLGLNLVRADGRGICRSAYEKQFATL